MSVTDSDAARNPFVGIAVNLLLLTAAGLLLLGLWAPLLRLEKFYFFTNEVSLFSALVTLKAEAEWGLFILIGAFSVLFPILKLVMLLLVWNLEAARSDRHKKHLHWLNLYSKWSMLDVFVVALLVVTVKLGAFAQATVGYGIYAFAASVILTMLISAYVGGEHRDRGVD